MFFSLPSWAVALLIFAVVGGACVGGAFLGAGWVAMSGVREPWHPYVIYGVVAAIGMSATFVPCSATVTRWPLSLY